MTGAVTNIDLAEILFTLFWVFFVGLIIYLRREDKREGYPLESDRRGRVAVQGFPAVPAPKSFSLAHGGTQTAPRAEPPQGNIAATPAAPHPGAPLVPDGDPLLAAVGPGAYAQRSDTPDLTLEGTPRVIPLRAAGGFGLDRRDKDPRGMSVFAADRKEVGTITDAWIDVAEPQIFYLEAELSAEYGGRQALLPFSFVNMSRARREVTVDALYSHQFAGIPHLASPDQVTLLEEDKLCAYFGGGMFYADETRQEPLF